MRSAPRGYLKMYEQFYGLKENPFNVTPNPEYIYLGEHHKEALAQLLYGVREKKGFIVITGEVGAGKTTLIHYLLDKLDGNSHNKTAFLFNPKLTVDDFIQYILKDLGVRVQGQTKGEHLHNLHRYLLNAYRKDERVVLIVDEAHGLNPELLEEIRLLSNLETSKSKLLQIVLVGQTELDKTLSQPEFRQLRQRINLRYHLPSLSERETKEYIDKRLRIAGAQNPLFTERAVKEIYMKSGGIPRLINILCDNALLNGYALDQKIVDAWSVKETAKDLKLGRKYRRIWIRVLFCIVSAASILFLSHFNKGGYLLTIYKGVLRAFQYLGGIVMDEFHYLFNWVR
ncbi:MAG TPA: AAA family ATPase [Thermodesulfobacteriota bacterium]|nr:AAA family ATPase [Thermodesulfobacteriota bacterium]